MKQYTFVLFRNVKHISTDYVWLTDDEFVRWVDFHKSQGYTVYQQV